MYILTLNMLFLVLHAHAAIWKELGYLTARNSPIKYGPQILSLLEAVLKPSQVTVIHCRSHQKGDDEITKGNWLADQAAQQAALQPFVIEGTLVPSLSSLPYPSYLPEEIK